MPAVVRGCGTRVKNGVYAETLLGPDGHPIECFIKDPAMPIDAQAMGLTQIGIKLIEHDGVTHIFDWVGEGYYPNVSDFIEEVRRFGASRRLPSNLDFSKLSVSSRLILLHSRALTPGFDPPVDSPQRCPRIIKAMHDRLSLPIDTHICAAQWWADHDAKERLLPGERYTREMPSFSYAAQQRPGPYVPLSKVGIFMTLPIHQIAVVRDPSTDAHTKTMEKVGGSLSPDIPLNLVDE
jgi:hypothetical protein